MVPTRVRGVHEAHSYCVPSLVIEAIGLPLDALDRLFGAK
jgi:hypothetical protein